MNKIFKIKGKVLTMERKEHILWISLEKEKYL